MCMIVEIGNFQTGGESDTYNHVVDNAMECCKELNERLSNLSLGLTKGKEVYNPHISLYAYEYKELPWTHKELNTMMK